MGEIIYRLDKPTSFPKRQSINKHASLFSTRVENAAVGQHVLTRVRSFAKLI